MSALAYHRMPGFGDLPGDSNHPGSPDYVEPVFGRDDAAGNVAARMAQDDEVGELVEDVANARALLAWIGREVVIPASMRVEWQALERHAKALDRRIDRELSVLNGWAA